MSVVFYDGTRQLGSIPRIRRRHKDRLDVAVTEVFTDDKATTTSVVLNSVCSYCDFRLPCMLVDTELYSSWHRIQEYICNCSPCLALTMPLKQSCFSFSFTQRHSLCTQKIPSYCVYRWANIPTLSDRMATIRSLVRSMQCFQGTSPES